MRKLCALTLILALLSTPSFACGGSSSHTSYLSSAAKLDAGLVRTGGWKPLWMQAKLSWITVPMMWDSMERYYAGEVAIPDYQEQKLFILPESGEMYSSVEALPKLKEWKELRVARRFVRLIANGRVFAYGLDGRGSGQWCGPNDRKQDNNYFWDRKRGSNYCQERRPRPRRNGEQPPPRPENGGVLGCIEAPEPIVYRWDVTPEAGIVSLMFTDQDGDGVFERLDAGSIPPLPQWAKQYAKVNRRTRLYRFGWTTSPLTPEMLVPRTKVVLARQK